MQIEFIQYPYAFTNTGERVDIRTVAGHVRIGATLEPAGDGYAVIGSGDDSECVGGACPIK
ncbi:hypothetical protein [Anaerotalea alkaliphila]|uniref:Uncharacterized protein n=1 Tax=Anaerotalea alkaliphila TaxID=2662126 RepID=A0A7X5KMX6_9FIRM|nr:hypothetical protein [Anaerotalea alkaliphila]NDL68416.1 hypothetical protein [Anaerotalea alkaliphila]